MLIPNVLYSERVSVLKSTRTNDGEGGWTDSWQEIGTLSATTAVRPPRVSTSQDVAAGEIRAPEELMIYADDPQRIVTSDCRIQVKDGRTFKIVQFGHQASLAQIFGVAV